MSDVQPAEQEFNMLEESLNQFKNRKLSSFMNFHDNDSEINDLKEHDDEMMLEHQQQNSTIQENPQSDDLSTASNNQQTQDFPLYSHKNKKSRGSQNSIPSNLVREFIHSIRYQLKFLGAPLQIINKFIQDNGIKSQRWAIDALLLILIFLRDQKNDISQQDFMRVRGHFLEKVIQKRERAKSEMSKEMFQNYISHIEKFEQVQFGDKSLTFIQIHSKILFSFIVIKRKNEIENYLAELQMLHESLKSQEIFYKKRGSPKRGPLRNKNSSSLRDSKKRIKR